VIENKKKGENIEIKEFYINLHVKDGMEFTAC